MRPLCVVCVFVLAAAVLDHPLQHDAVRIVRRMAHDSMFFGVGSLVFPFSILAGTLQRERERERERESVRAHARARSVAIRSFDQEVGRNQTKTIL